jgi:solute carrier family 25 citrate transporter 1
MSAPTKTKKNTVLHLVSGGVAGCCEALACHPLDTIKVRLQLRGERQVRTRPISTIIGDEALKIAAQEAAKPKKQSFIAVGAGIAQKEGILSLYKGLGAVVTGIVPKMAIRFSSFEYFKGKLADQKTGIATSPAIFMGMRFIQ